MTSVTLSRRPVTTAARPLVDLPIQPAPAPSGGGLLAGLRAGFREFFRAAEPLPSVAERVQAVLATIDPRDPTIVVWVPGTSEWWVKPAFLEALHAAEPGHRITFIPYQGTWEFSRSRPDGEAVLRGVLRGIAARFPRARVLLAGESQGAWIISNVLADPSLRRVVTRGALVGHPGVAPTHTHDGSDPKLAEFNNPQDLITIDPGDAAREQVARGVELVSRKRFAEGVPPLLGYLFSRPQMLWGLIRSQLHYVPALSEKIPDAHDYTEAFRDAAAWLAAAPGGKVRPRRSRARASSRRS
jgi:hypothetical protein